MNDPTAINIAICEALGLDPKHIAKDGVTITLDGHLGPVITVTYQTLHDDDLGPRIENVLKQYRLVPLADGGPTPDPTLPDPSIYAFGRRKRRNR